MSFKPSFQPQPNAEPRYPASSSLPPASRVGETHSRLAPCQRKNVGVDVDVLKPLAWDANAMAGPMGEKNMSESHSFRGPQILGIYNTHQVSARVFY